MKQYFRDIDIRNIENASKIFNGIKKLLVDKYTCETELDVEINYFNFELVENSLDEEKASEIQKYHYLFMREIRELFSSINIKVNELGLKGTVNELSKGVLSIEVIESSYISHKINNVIPCKEMYLYEDNLKTLDLLLETNMISEREYEENILDLQNEMNIEIIEIDNKYLN